MYFLKPKANVDARAEATTEDNIAAKDEAKAVEAVSETEAEADEAEAAAEAEALPLALS